MTRILAKRDRDVYRWEHETIRSQDRRELTEPEARGIVSYVWGERGLRAPPSVRLNDRITGATGTRTEIELGRGGRTTAVLLHELAHSMDESIEVRMGFLGDRPKGESVTGSAHDDNWLGLYLDLLNDFMPPSFNKLWLMKTLHDRGLSFSLCPVIRGGR